jgi:DNA invertase Pin-like site-specific DNA recombinase
MFIRAYLRASTKEQDANRARAELDQFVMGKGLQIASYYTENESGTKLVRPELMRLLDDAKAGDVLLIEQVDRLSRLNAADWLTLRRMITDKGLRIVSLDLPTSHIMLGQVADSFTALMLAAINNMMLDMLAAIARKDYEDRRRRQAQGIATNKNKFKGKQIDQQKHANVAKLLDQGNSYSEIQELLGVSRSTISRVVKLGVTSK